MVTPRSTRSEILSATSAGLLVVFFCLILFWHNPLLFWNDDYELSVLPVFADMARSWSEGHWPILGPYSWVCGNLAGEFQYGVFSVFVIAWLVLKSLAETRSILSVAPMLFGVALGLGLSAPAWLAILDLVQGSARELQAARAHWQWLVPPAALPGLILPCWTVNWADFSSRYLPHTATELASGLVAPAALIAGLLWPGRVLVKQIKWELLLLLLVLLLCMIPTAGLFRWSFRWLPFFHLALAICAAEALQMAPRSATVATTTLGLVVLTAIAMLILRASGPYAFPLVWIFIALAAGWYLSELVLRDFEFRTWIPVSITFLAFLTTYYFMPTNCGV